MLIDQQLRQIKINLDEAKTWMAFKSQAIRENNAALAACYQWRDLRSRKWTPVLNPGIPPLHEVDSGIPLEKALIDKMPKWFPHLIKNRHECLVKEGLDAAAFEKQRGRILCSLYGASMLCTAAESVSDLYVDGTERPTWDSWIWWSNELAVPEVHSPVLLAWVPEEDEDMVQTAIDATPYNNLHWLSNLNLPWADLLRKQGMA